MSYEDLEKQRIKLPDELIRKMAMEAEGLRYTKWPSLDISLPVVTYFRNIPQITQDDFLQLNFTKP